MLIKRIENLLAIARVKRDFKRQATLGKEIKFLPQSNIFNKTKDKSKVCIGDCCELGCQIIVTNAGQISIGPYTTIRHKTILNSTVGISIGSDVIISNHCFIYDNNSHPTSPSTRLKMTRSGFHGELWKNKYADASPITIEDNVWIGQRVMIMKGVTIGKGSIVAAGAVVTKNVPPYSIAAGNPAKVVKTIDDSSSENDLI